MTHLVPSMYCFSLLFINQIQLTTTNNFRTQPWLSRLHNHVYPVTINRPSPSTLPINYLQLSRPVTIPLPSLPSTSNASTPPLCHHYTFSAPKPSKTPAAQHAIISPTNEPFSPGHERDSGSWLWELRWRSWMHWRR